LNFTTNAADVKNLRHFNIAAAVVVCVVPTKNVLTFSVFAVADILLSYAATT
jgi:hypothetical protein